MTVPAPLMALSRNLVESFQLFLVSRERSTSTDIPFDAGEVRQRVADQQVTGPVFSSLNAAGDAVTVTAETMRSTGEEAHNANKIAADYELTGGTEVNVKASDGQVNMIAQTAKLTGDVEITTSNGIMLRSDLVDATIEPLEIVSPGPVAGEAPFGTLSAGGMRLLSPAETGTGQMIFTNGVKLVYQPSSAGKLR